MILHTKDCASLIYVILFDVICLKIENVSRTSLDVQQSANPGSAIRHGLMHSRHMVLHLPKLIGVFLDVRKVALCIISNR